MHPVRSTRRSTVLAAGLVALTCLAGPVSPVANAQPAPFELDRPFPDVVLPALGGAEPMSIADFRGQKVVLQVFAAW